uniref:Rhodanese domain-containing protein n=1 Tax=Trieres chinensis TaxID=1514140 RepID=A0A7S2A0J5_TRICV
MRTARAAAAALLAAGTRTASAFSPSLPPALSASSSHASATSSFAAFRPPHRPTLVTAAAAATTTTARFLSSSSFDPSSIEIVRVDKSGMEEIIEDVEEAGRDGSGYVVIDVRGEEEIAYTGKIADCAETLPLPYIAMQGAFNLDDDDFEIAHGFPKPTMDETIVFSCKAGIRSYQAAQFAAMAGYTNLINYTGGADEWFR